MDKSIFQKDTCTPAFTTAPFTLAKVWEQPKCPSTDERTEDMLHIGKGLSLSHKTLSYQEAYRF